VRYRLQPLAPERAGRSACWHAGLNGQGVLVVIVVVIVVDHIIGPDRAIWRP
jgi:hypothetical protein